MDYFQLGSDLNKAPYTGGDSTQVVYGGEHKTVALPATAAQNDTVEIPLCELPAGAKINGLKWAIGGSLGNNTTGTLVLRKKTNTINPATTIAGSGGGASSGVAAGVAGLTAVQINSANASVTTTSANNASATIIPSTFEGLATPLPTLQEAYYLCLKVAFGATPTWVSGIKVYAAAEAEFIGTL